MHKPPRPGEGVLPLPPDAGASGLGTAGGILGVPLVMPPSWVLRPNRALLPSERAQIQTVQDEHCSHHACVAAVHAHRMAYTLSYSSERCESLRAG